MQKIKKLRLIIFLISSIKEKSYHQYLGPWNAFSQNVHFRGPNWINWTWTWYGIFLIRQKPTLRAEWIIFFFAFSATPFLKFIVQHCPEGRMSYLGSINIIYLGSRIDLVQIMHFFKVLQAATFFCVQCDAVKLNGKLHMYNLHSRRKDQQFPNPTFLCCSFLLPAPCHAVLKGILTRRGVLPLKDGKTRDRQLSLKPTVLQGTDWKVEKTYHLAPYLGSFCVYFMPQCSKRSLIHGGQLTLSWNWLKGH